MIDRIYPIWETPGVANVSHRMKDHLVSPIPMRTASGADVFQIVTALPGWSQEIIRFYSDGPWHSYMGSTQTEYIMMMGDDNYTFDKNNGIWIRTPDNQDILIRTRDQRGFLKLPPEIPRRWSVSLGDCLTALIFTNPPFDPAKAVLCEI